MDVVDRSNRPEVLGGLNPSLRVPTLVLDDGRPLGESGAILWYFAEGTRFVPDDPYERAQVLQWMFFEQYDLEPAIAVVRFWVAYSGTAGGLRRPAARTDGGGQSRAGGARAPPRAPAVPRRRRYSLADIALYGVHARGPEGGFDLEPYPAVRAWLDRVAAEPGHVPIDA